MGYVPLKPKQRRPRARAPRSREHSEFGERARQVAAFVAVAALVLVLAVAARGETQTVDYRWKPSRTGPPAAHYEVRAVCSSSSVAARLVGSPAVVPLGLEWRRLGIVTEPHAELELVGAVRGLQIAVRGVSEAGKPGLWSVPSDPWPASIAPGAPGQPRIMDDWR